MLRLYFRSSSKVCTPFCLTLTDIATGVSCGDLGASIGLENDNDIFVWNVIFEGPADTLYEVSNRKIEHKSLLTYHLLFVRVATSKRS